MGAAAKSGSALAPSVPGRLGYNRGKPSNILDYKKANILQAGSAGLCACLAARYSCPISPQAASHPPTWPACHMHGCAIPPTVSRRDALRRDPQKAYRSDSSQLLVDMIDRLEPHSVTTVQSLPEWESILEEIEMAGFFGFYLTATGPCTASGNTMRKP